MKPSGQWFSSLLKGLVVLSAIMALIALAFLPASYHRDNSLHWPTASGLVSNIALKTYLNKKYLDKPPKTYFTPFICYNDTVEGVPRAGTRIDFADAVRVFTKEEALKWLDRNYPVGKQVTVYYDPKNPDLAVLMPGAKDLVLICWAQCGDCRALLRRIRRSLEPAEGEISEDDTCHGSAWQLARLTFTRI